MKIEIIEAVNGYTSVVKHGHLEETRIHATLKELIQSIGEDALMHFEGRARTFKGSSHGEVKVEID